MLAFICNCKLCIIVPVADLTYPVPLREPDPIVLPVASVTLAYQIVSLFPTKLETFVTLCVLEDVFWPTTNSLYAVEREIEFRLYAYATFPSTKDITKINVTTSINFLRVFIFTLLWASLPEGSPSCSARRELPHWYHLLSITFKPFVFDDNSPAEMKTKRLRSVATHYP